MNSVCKSVRNSFCLKCNYIEYFISIFKIESTPIEYSASNDKAIFKEWAT